MRNKCSVCVRVCVCVCVRVCACLGVCMYSFPANPEIAGDGLDKNDGSVDGQRANEVKKQNPTHEGF